MKWKELAAVINNMSDKEKDKEVLVWDSSVESTTAGCFFRAISCSPYDEHVPEDYSLDINTLERTY